MIIRHAVTKEEVDKLKNPKDQNEDVTLPVNVSPNNNDKPKSDMVQMSTTKLESLLQEASNKAIEKYRKNSHDISLHEFLQCIYEKNVTNREVGIKLLEAYKHCPHSSKLYQELYDFFYDAHVMDEMLYYVKTSTDYIDIKDGVKVNKNKAVEQNKELVKMIDNMLIKIGDKASSMYYNNFYQIENK